MELSTAGYGEIIEYVNAGTNQKIMLFSKNKHIPNESICSFREYTLKYEINNHKCINENMIQYVNSLS